MTKTGPGVEGFLRDLRDGNLTETGRRHLQWAGYHVGTREAYPVTISQPPATVSDHRVIGWTEVVRREGNYPGGIVLAVDPDPEALHPYVIWDVATRNGGSTWFVSGSGDYYTAPRAAWRQFFRYLEEHIGTLATT